MNQAAYIYRGNHITHFPGGKGEALGKDMNYELAKVLPGRAGTGILEIWLQSLMCRTLQGRPDAGSLEGGDPSSWGGGLREE